VLLVWPFVVLGLGLLVGQFMIYLVQPPKWQHNCILAATAFANAMGMPITLMDVIGHNFQPPFEYNPVLDPSMFQSIYVILNPVLQWGLGGWLLSSEDDSELQGGEEEDKPKRVSQEEEDDSQEDEKTSIDTGDGSAGFGTFASTTGGPPVVAVPRRVVEQQRNSFLRSKVLSVVSLEDAGYDTEASPFVPRGARRNRRERIQEKEEDSSDGDDDWQVDLEERAGLLIPPPAVQQQTSGNVSFLMPPISQQQAQQAALLPPSTVPEQPMQPQKRSSPTKQAVANNGSSKNSNDWARVLRKIASKALAPPAVGAMLGFVVAACTPLRGLFVDLEHRADNAPLEWIFDGILTLAQSAIPVNMCVVGVNLSIATQRRTTPVSSNGKPAHATTSARDDAKTFIAVVLGKMLVLPLIGTLLIYILKTYFWSVPQDIQFQFYLVLLMNFVTPTANVVMVIAELGSGPESKKFMASLIGWQYIAAPILLSLTVMMIVWMAVLQ